MAKLQSEVKLVNLYKMSTRKEEEKKLDGLERPGVELVSSQHQ